jgi:hypothetical protein
MAQAQRLRMVNGDLVGYASSQAQFDKVWAPRGWELRELDEAPAVTPPAGGDGAARATAQVDNSRARNDKAAPDPAGS